MIYRSNFHRINDFIYSDVLDPLNRVKRCIDFEESVEVLFDKPYTLAKVCNVYEGYKKGLEATEKLEKLCSQMCDELDIANTTIQMLQDKIKNMERWIYDTKTDSTNS